MASTCQMGNGECYLRSKYQRQQMLIIRLFNKQERIATATFITHLNVLPIIIQKACMKANSKVYNFIENKSNNKNFLCVKQVTMWMLPCVQANDKWKCDYQAQNILTSPSTLVHRCHLVKRTRVKGGQDHPNIYKHSKKSLQNLHMKRIQCSLE